jgi:ribosome recycling factor
MAYDFKPLDGQVKETEEWLAREFTSIRTGRAAPALLDNVKADSYGARTPLTQIGSITIEDARTLRIVPWDKSLMKAIEKAIMEADLGVSVGSDDLGLRVFFPELTAERRTLLLKLAHEKVEQAKVTLRGHRAQAIKDIDAAEKEGGMGKDESDRLKAEVQKKIDAGSEALEALSKRKHDEIAI